MVGHWAADGSVQALVRSNNAACGPSCTTGGVFAVGTNCVPLIDILYAGHELRTKGVNCE